MILIKFMGDMFSVSLTVLKLKCSNWNRNACRHRGFHSQADYSNNKWKVREKWYSPRPWQSYLRVHALQINESSIKVSAKCDPQLRMKLKAMQEQEDRKENIFFSFDPSKAGMLLVRRVGARGNETERKD